MNSLKHNHRLATSIACALLLTSPAAVQAAKTALVIGNADYQWPQVSDLPNPKRDVEGMKQALTELGFNVIYRINLTQADLEAAFQEFGKTLQEAKKNAPVDENVALFYYAGHAAEYQGTNYLLATNLTEKTTAANADSPANANRLEKDYEGIVPVPRLYGEINAVGETTNIFIVDACRNNPLLSYNEVTGRGEVTRSVGLQLEDTSFKTGGGFMGVAYSWQLRQSLLGISLAGAMLTGDYTENIKDPIAPQNNNDVESTLGLTIGASWNGPITNRLSYSLSLDRYRYSMDVDREIQVEGKTIPRQFSLEENMTTFRASLSYSFDW
jgi:Caspase domain